MVFDDHHSGLHQSHARQAKSSFPIWFRGSTPIGAIPARQDVGLTLLFDHKLLQARHDRLAIGKREADLPLSTIG